MAKIYGDIVCFRWFFQTPFYQMTKTQKFGWIAVQRDAEISQDNRPTYKETFGILMGKLVHLYIAQSSRYVK